MVGPKPFEPNRDIDSPNRNIAPISCKINESGKLVVGGCQLSDLAKKYGTPLYVFDELSLRTACKTYISSLKKYYPGESLPLYASKANSSLAICALIASEGFGLDAVSEGELLTALKGGVKGKDIVFHGNNKSHNELNFAYNNDVTIVLDNHHDIDLLKNIASDKKIVNLML